MGQPAAAGYGWCLDWLDRQSESEPYFWRAEELDPNNYYNVNNIGLHFVQVALRRRQALVRTVVAPQCRDNPIAQNYLALCVARMEEAATNEVTAKFHLTR